MSDNPSKEDSEDLPVIISKLPIKPSTNIKNAMYLRQLHANSSHESHQDKLDIMLIVKNARRQKSQTSVNIPMIPSNLNLVTNRNDQNDEDKLSQHTLVQSDIGKKHLVFVQNNNLGCPNPEEFSPMSPVSYYEEVCMAKRLNDIIEGP